MSAGCAMASVSLSSRVVPTVVEARPVHSSSRQVWQNYPVFRAMGNCRNLCAAR